MSVRLPLKGDEDMRLARVPHLVFNYAIYGIHGILRRAFLRRHILFLSIPLTVYDILWHAILVASGDDFLGGAESLHWNNRQTFLLTSRVISSLCKVQTSCKQQQRQVTSLDLVESQEQGDEIGCLPKEVNSGENASCDFLFVGSSGGSSDGRVVAEHRQAISERMF